MCDLLLVNVLTYVLSCVVFEYCGLLVKFLLSTRGYLSLTHSFGGEPPTLKNMKFGIKELEASLYHIVQLYVGVFNCLGMHHECDRQMDRRNHRQQ